MTTVCPYCRAPFEPEEAVTECEACATPHHADCYAENGGCTVFGCARAPEDEPKVSISVSDLSDAAPRQSTAPPPPRPGSTTSVPPPPRPAQAPPPEIRLAPPHQFTFGGYAAPAATPAAVSPYTPRRSRLTYILLGVFLGAFGGHNFYAGYTKRAVFQLLLTVLTLFMASLITWIWALIEVCTVTQDSDGVAFV